MYLLRRFAHQHDEILAFHVAFAVLTFISAAMLSLGWFAIFIVGHMVLDVIKYKEVHEYSWRNTINAVLHESLLELMLFSIALLVSVYFHSSIYAINISGFMRAEMTLVRLVGVIIPKFIIIEEILKIFIHFQHYLEAMHPNAKNIHLTLPEKIYAGVIVISTILLLAAPYITNTAPHIINTIILNELTL